VSTPISGTPRVIRLQRTALSILILSGIVNYLDRATLAVANPLIRGDLGLNVAQMGVLLSAFLWAYAFSQLPAGALVDRVGPRWLLGIGLMVWSVAQIVAGTVSTVAQFAVARVFLGVGESPQFTSGVRVVRDWFNVRERAFGVGMVNTSPFIGQAIAPPLLTAMMLGLGWRWMFILMGLAGMAVAVIWVVWFRDPRSLPLEAEERAYLSEGDPPEVVEPITFAQWRHLFAFRSTWGLIIGCFGLGYCTWLYGTWLPGYLEIERHMSIRATGYVASIPFALAVLGAIGGGLLADRLVRRGVSPVNSRKVPLVIGMVGVAVFTSGAAEVSSNLMAVGCVTLAMVCGAMCSGLYWALASAIAPSNCTASAGSLANFGSYIGGAITPTATGFIVQATGSFTPAFLLGGAIALLSALSYLVLVKNESMDFSQLNAKISGRPATG
jgi:sugar phosphate permease